MSFDTALLHEVCLKILYGCLVIVTFVIVERLVFYGWLSVQARRLERVIRLRAADATTPADNLEVSGTDVVSRSLAEYLAAQRQPGMSRGKIEDLSAALFIKVDARIGARLWLLDTIVTAAPLLGLLGTILGIMDTFNALSAGGISDPAAVSRGIGAALLATAVGILTALYGLIGHNVLHRQADRLTEDFKGFLLSSTSNSVDTRSIDTRSAVPAE